MKWLNNLSTTVKVLLAMTIAIMVNIALSIILYGAIGVLSAVVGFVASTIVIFVLLYDSPQEDR